MAVWSFKSKTKHVAPGWVGYEAEMALIRACSFIKIKTEPMPGVLVFLLFIYC